MFCEMFHPEPSPTSISFINLIVLYVALSKIFVEAEKKMKKYGNIIKQRILHRLLTMTHILRKTTKYTPLRSYERDIQGVLVVFRFIG